MKQARYAVLAADGIGRRYHVVIVIVVIVIVIGIVVVIMTILVIKIIPTINVSGAPFRS